MSRIYYQEPPEWDTYDIVGRANMSIFSDNDQLFFGLARRQANLHRGAVHDSGVNYNQVIYDSYHYLEADATLFRYKFGGKRNTSTNCTFTLYYDFNGIADPGTTIASVTTASADVVYTSGSVNLSTAYGYTPGLYRVVVYLTGEAGISYVQYLETTYTSTDYTFITPPIIYDERQSTVNHFNKWRANDRYFHQTQPRQHAFSGIHITAQSGTQTVWSSWAKHRFHEMYYRVWISTDSNSAKLTLYYDRDGANESSVELTADGTWLESSWTVGSGVTVGDRVWVSAVLTNTAGLGGASCTIDYLRMAPEPDTTPGSPWVQMGEFSPGQWVYGDTTGYTTALKNLSNADNYIFPRLCWNATVGRIDYVVAQPTWNGHPIGTTGHFSLQRRYDMLYYRTTEATLHWGTDDSYSLTDYDDTGYTTGVDYNTLDLTTLDGLAHGQTYYIRTDGGHLHFAQERPS